RDRRFEALYGFDAVLRPPNVERQELAAVARDHELDQREPADHPGVRSAVQLAIESGRVQRVRRLWPAVSAELHLQALARLCGAPSIAKAPRFPEDLVISRFAAARRGSRAPRAA